MPVVAVGNTSGEWIGRALRYGIRGLLPQTASVEELASAVRAVAAGLLVISPEFGDVMLSQSNTAEAEESEVAIEALTPREQQVLAMLSEGLLNKEIADRMQISEHTVKFHISSIMGKLGASSRTEAVTRGIRRGLVFV
jgi:DNA-binding NarL/FixJ family response regulator